VGLAGYVSGVATSGNEDSGGRPTAPLDVVATALAELRLDAGSPSFTEIVNRIGHLRAERGAGEVRPARTTVYDVFRVGRRRLDVGLVLDIVRALGADEATVEHWATECRRAVGGQMPRLGAQPPEAAEAAEEQKSPREQAVESRPDPEPRPDSEAPVDPPGPRAVPESPREAETAPGLAPDRVWPESTRRPIPLLVLPRRISVRPLVLVLVACVVANLLGRGLVQVVQIPLHLDMVGTALASILLGPWWGALCGLTTAAAGVPISSWDSMAFAPVQIVGALLWGYGVRRFDLGRDLGRYFLLNVVVAFVCTCLSVPILAQLGYVTSNASTEVEAAIAQAVGVVWVGVFIGNLITSVADKMISGFVALVVSDSVADRIGDVPPPDAEPTALSAA